MRKAVVALSILAMLAMIAWKITQPIREQKARRAELLLTSDAANLDRVVRVWGDDWLGYLIFRSRRFQKEMQQYRLGVRFDLVYDFKERFRGLEKGDCDFVAATIDSYLTNGGESGYPGVITWVIDESYGADAIIGGPKIKSVDALNQASVSGAFVGFSPSEFLLKAQVANFRMNALLPRVASFRKDKEEDAYVALAKGKADFAVLWEPFVSQALKEINGTTRLLDSSQTKGIVVDVAIASRKALAADPGLAEKVARAYFNTLNYYLDHADEFRELAAADSSKDTSTAATMLNGIKFASFGENCGSWFGLDAKLPADGLLDAINRVAHILSEVGDLKDDPFNGNPFSIVNSKPLRTLNEAPAELLANEVRTPNATPMPGGAAFFRRLSDDEWKRVARNVVGTLVDEPIIFGSGSAGVPEDFQSTLHDAIYRLAYYPKYRVIINGYVSPGSDPEADQQLSEARSETIKRYLVEEGGVQEDRIFAQGLGSSDLPTRMPDESDAAWKRRARRAKIYLAQRTVTDNLRSTFPLNEGAIARQALRQIFADPITWVPLVPVVAAYTIFDVPALLALGLGVLILGAVAGYWRKHWPEITAELRRQAVTKNNRDQDAILRAAADELRQAREKGFAEKLEKFLGVKRRVEARLHEDGQLTPQKIQLEQLVDALCFGVRDQLQALLAREKVGEEANRPEVLRQVDDAFQTLQTAVAELDIILGPSDASEGATSASLEEITRRLREETEIARRVQARLRAQEPASFSPEPPPMESQ